MITRIAVVPYPPLLVPELTVRTGPETGQLRSACLRAVSSLTDTAREWVVVAADRYGPRVLGPDTVGTFAGYGVDVAVSLGAAAHSTPDPQLPLPALVTGWLREQAGAERATVHVLGTGTAPNQCRELGASLAPGDDPTGLLVLADGTNCRDARSPYPPDDRAEGVDEQIRAALADADPARLLELDPDLCAQTGVEGRAALQALAGAAQAAGRWDGELLYSATPFGVTYHVAIWARPGD